MKATTWRGAPGTLPATAKKKRKKKAPAPRGFMCGCGSTRSVSVDISAVTTTPMKRGASTAVAPAGEPASAAKTTAGRGRDADADASAEGTPSVDSLLRQLRELERGVRALGVREREADGGVGGSGSSTAGTTKARPSPRPGHVRSASVVGRRLDSESVAVVTESEDPLGDFRRSMAQMIVENGITGGAELRELLRRFLALNAACHHHLILRAFADVWDELFSGGGGGGSHVAAQSHGSGGGRASKRPRGRADTLS
ncbi:hypothetical protein BDA96_01G558900 [Sorghum bicolor]|uniref:Transcription repressor n=2 Tax=Sorghum bicolor TaxID=4558 RepID=A0A921V289_SORBI|nr:transcription repressor OFP8 [Sorghum bicolor]EER92948.1 hypothetical protein SORBI_3001G523500 [Sorghum bicolor]KAG0553017.1 hypothetical protein BDA96_01G558900 [Sorghum bicolor]|eukprot:XP_002465950.1 transcription repressor OFP8 [Sorghum bicolor]